MATEVAASIPFGAFVHLVPADKSVWERRERYPRAVADLVQRAAAGPLVLEVDDAHLLDPAGTLPFQTPDVTTKS